MALTTNEKLAFLVQTQALFGMLSTRHLPSDKDVQGHLNAVTFCLLQLPKDKLRGCSTSPKAMVEAANSITEWMVVDKGAPEKKPSWLKK